MHSHDWDTNVHDLNTLLVQIKYVSPHGYTCRFTVFMKELWHRKGNENCHSNTVDLHTEVKNINGGDNF